MIFSDPKFYFFFLPLSVIGFQLMGRFGRRAAVGFLALMSLVFYGRWNAFYLPLLIGSILFNFSVSILIEKSAGRERRQAGWLVFGIVSNLGALVFFKYLFPFLNFVNSAGNLHHPWPNLLLPLGISFFTFTQIAYLVDLKQGVAQRETLLIYSFFVTFFPHLIAGPIVHHKEIMPQLREERHYQLNSADIALGLSWFTMGMWKKVMIADRLAWHVDSFFSRPQDAGLWQSWSGALLYAMQLYFDFSGYSDMALGIARVFSIRLPINFDSPFKAQSIIDFWNRWHMTLSRYIMAYLYSPILFRISRQRRRNQRNKGSKPTRATVRGFISLIALPTLFTMFIAGVWHGAGFQFLLYGLMHGCYITINYFWRTFIAAKSRSLHALMNGPVSIAVTFLCVLLSFVMFRADGVAQAMTVYGGLTGRHGLGVHVAFGEVVILLALFGVVWLMPNTQEILGEEQRNDAPNWSLFRVPRWRPSLAWWAGVTATFAVCMAWSTLGSTFLYFQF